MFHISSSMNAAQARAAQIASTAEPLVMPGLSTTDTQSTIRANETGKRAYSFAQSVSATMSESLKNAASSIRAAAITFEDFDNSR